MVLHLIPIVGELSLLNGESVEWRNTQIFPATWPDHSLTHLLSQPDMPLFIFLLISSILNAYRFSGGYRVDMKQAKLINKYETILVPCWYLCCWSESFLNFGTLMISLFRIRIFLEWLRIQLTNCPDQDHDLDPTSIFCPRLLKKCSTFWKWKLI